MLRLFLRILACILFIALLAPACAPAAPSAGGAVTSRKVSSQLSTQISLRTAQIAGPTPERLAAMQGMGMNVGNLATQRIFIYLARQLTPVQTDELQSLGIKLYPDSWIPPVGNHPAGYLLADMPVDKLAELTRKDYVISVDTAERQLQPQNNFQPQ